MSAATAPAAPAKKPADLPLNRVVLFTSGVGFFEHGGKVSGDARIDLKFNVNDINDLLKSMVLEDQGGGRISTVTYGSRDPISKTLKTFSVDLTREPRMSDLLPRCGRRGPGRAAQPGDRQNPRHRAAAKSGSARTKSSRSKC